MDKKKFGFITRWMIAHVGPFIIEEVAPVVKDLAVAAAKGAIQAQMEKLERK